MATRPKISHQKRRENFLSGDDFVKNAALLFYKANKLGAAVNQPEVILAQMLHSILFLGNIHAARFKPEEIFAETKVLEQTRADFPEPFNHYRSHVALRTPFSYFLELVTKYCDQNNRDVINTLSEELKDCAIADDKHPLISSVMCICTSARSKYCGVSLSCESPRERKIMTAVSCLHVWHPKVSSAVMSVFPDGTGTVHRITLPDAVTCTAYRIKREDEEIVFLEIPPCRRCHEFYSLPRNPTDPGILNHPGNCAETEAISNFFHAEDPRTTNQRLINCFNDNMKNREGDYDINTLYVP